MKQFNLALIASFLLWSCGGNSLENEAAHSTETSSTNQQSKRGRNNYAVVWEWTTANAKLVQENLSTISNELTELRKADKVENVYYNNETSSESLDYIANISFFLKAHSEEEAQTILNDLTIVKNGWASYKLYPVGLLWLDRNTDKIAEDKKKRSFVAVWETLKETNLSDVLIQSQNDAVLELWNTGKIENVYFDIEGTQKNNSIQDFVFFVNANTQAEAESICNSLPFYKEKLASYKLHSVGVFWMGRYKND